MTFTLDSIIDATVNTPRITGEQHDTSRINWVNGLTDPGEMIRCGYLPALRRRPGEQDAEYAARITPLVMALPQAERDKIMGAAISRANLDVANGRVAVMVAGKPAWHGLGVNVAEAVTSEHALRLAGLDWKVEKLPTYYTVGDRTIRANDEYALVRSDTGAMIAAAGKQYKPIQNSDGFSFMDAVLQQYGARYETAGALFGGKKVWMQALLPNLTFSVAPGDEVTAYATFINPHVPGEAAVCFPTTDRAVCQNTLRIAERGSKHKGIRLAHRGNMDAKIGAAQEALGLAVRQVATFREQAEALVKAPVASIRHYANDVLDAVLEVTEAQAKLGADVLAAALQVTEAQRELARKDFAAKIERREEALEDILERYDSERCGVGGIRGSAWAALNAVTEHVDHTGRRQRGTQEERYSRRWEDALLGAGDELKQAALEKALAYVPGQREPVVVEVRR